MPYNEQQGLNLPCLPIPSIRRGVRSRNRTCTLEILSFLPLPVGLYEQKWSRYRESNPAFRNENPLSCR